MLITVRSWRWWCGAVAGLTATPVCRRDRRAGARRGLRVVRTGTTRTVILIGRWAVKVPTGRGVGVDSRSARGRLAGVCRGVLANQSEHTWHRYEPWAGRVAPVRASWLGGLVQAYPRCEPLAPDDRGPLPHLDPYPGDVKPGNFGRIGGRGRVVRLDYDMH